MLHLPPKMPPQYDTFYRIVHSPDYAPRQLPVQGPSYTFGAPLIGPTAGNVGPPPAQYTNQRIDHRLPQPVLMAPLYPENQPEDDNFDLPTYTGHLVLTLTIPLKITNTSGYLATLIPLRQSDANDFESFKVCFKRNRSVMSTNDMAVAYTYMDDLPLRCDFLAISREAKGLRRIWVIAPELVAGLSPSDQAASDFMQNRAGVHLECRCGAFVYIPETLQWARYWASHLELYDRPTYT